MLFRPPLLVCYSCAAARIQLPVIPLSESPADQWDELTPPLNARGWAVWNFEHGREAVCPGCVQRLAKPVTYPAFDPWKLCPACGQVGAATRFCRGLVHDCAEPPGAHLHRICGRCGYGWVEACVKAIEVPKSEERHGKDQPTAATD